ncbi:MAG: SLC13 family permease [Sphingomonadales bacterium]
MVPLELTFSMWVAFAVIAGAIVTYTMERVPLELTSVGVLATLLVYFHFFPMPGPQGINQLGPRTLLAGFADPALFAIISLLVIGQGLVQTGALDGPARQLVRLGAARPGPIIALTLISVMVISAILNNTPVVVIFIPILSGLAERLGWGVSSVMMPLSMVAILGGMTTLIGSSTNLLVSGSLEASTGHALGFFEFTLPGLVLASVGLIYVLLIAPRLLGDRTPLAARLVGSAGRQFIAQIEVTNGSALIGEQAVAGMFPSLPNMTVRLVQRDEDAFLPPFDEVTLAEGDMVIVAATRQALTDLLSRTPALLQGVLNEASREGEGLSQPNPAGDRILAEAVVAPASRMDGRTLALFGFRHQTDCIVLGIQRRSRMIRAKLNDIRLQAGDVLLVIGRYNQVLGLRANQDVLLLEWSTTELPGRTHAKRAAMVFAGVVGLAALNIVPITIAAIAGAVIMIGGGCLNVRQAARAIDRRIVLMIGTALALGSTLQATGGAAYLAHTLVGLFADASPPVILSAFFLLIATLTNVLSNNATAVLFTPIALSLATEIGADPTVFIYAVLFAANCSFATPMGYQTNLLVMGPGHYKFADFIKAGVPLVFVIWITFSLFAPWYYGL